MLLAIMFAPRHSPSTTITAEVELPEWERVRTSLMGRRPRAPLIREIITPKSSEPLLSYRFDVEISMSTDPGTGKLRLNNHTQPDATMLAFDRLTQDGLDVTMLLESTEVEDQFVIQDKDLALHHQVWRKTGPVVDRTDFFLVPVEYVSGTIVFVMNQPLMVLTKSKNTFLSLTDTPAGYAGAGGQLVSVRKDETGLEFTPPLGAGSGSEPESSGSGLWIQCRDPKSEWVYYVNLADVKRIGPKFPGEEPQ